MKPDLIFALVIASTAAVVSAHAQTYQWKDSTGRTVISDTAPPRTTPAPRAIGSMQAQPVDGETLAEKQIEAPKTTVEKNLEFKKRQQEAKEKAEKEAKEQTASAEKRENCDRARRNLATLESDQPMAILDEKGERKIMDTSLRSQEMERARRFMAETCN
ncbi:MAG: DUF4124 domain-containing protein [Azonexus sp.]|nr:DUF4124 domain-containing protein [Azonexus sp.]MDZ4315889.1 DUF4124 domain-containing protein [Azonexus sp.]